MKIKTIMAVMVLSSVLIAQAEPRWAVNYPSHYKAYKESKHKHEFEQRKFDKKYTGGVASAMAMTSIPQAYEAGKSVVGGAVGQFRDVTALGIGASTISKDGHIILKSGITYDTNKNTGASVGVGYQW